MFLKKTRLWLGALGAVCVPATLMALVIPNSFSAGTVISASALNANMQAIATAVTALENGKADKPASGALLSTPSGVVSWARVSCPASGCFVTVSHHATGGAITASRVAQGIGSVTFEGASLDTASVQVTAYPADNTPTYCQALFITGAMVNVKCFDNTGTPHDTAFNITVIQ
jgi:hypothetical protein